MAALFQSPVPWYDDDILCEVAAGVSYVAQGCPWDSDTPPRYTVIVRRAFGVAGAAMVDRGDPNNRCVVSVRDGRGNGTLAHV